MHETSLGAVIRARTWSPTSGLYWRLVHARLRRASEPRWFRRRVLQRLLQDASASDMNLRGFAPLLCLALVLVAMFVLLVRMLSSTGQGVGLLVGLAVAGGAVIWMG